jgi:hypothetical protein
VPISTNAVDSAIEAKAATMPLFSEGSSGETMKIYNSSTAPNPRRVRVFLAEKGIQVPYEKSTS